MWCGTPQRSSGVGFAVPISMRRETCMESNETISPPSACASRTDRAVLPEAVGPTTQMILSMFKPS